MAIISLLLADGLAYGVVSSRESAAPATTTTLPPSTTTTQPAAAVDLTLAALPAPPGYLEIKVPVSGALSGSAGIDALVAARDDPSAAKAAFERNGFESAFVRSWQGAAPGDLLTLRLYQFASGDGAARYQADTVRGTKAAGRTEFPIPGASDQAVGISGGALDANGKAVLFGFATRGRVVVVLAAALAPPGDTNIVASALRQQLELLPPKA